MVTPESLAKLKGKKIKPEPVEVETEEEEGQDPFPHSEYLSQEEEEEDEEEEAYESEPEPAAVTVVRKGGKGRRSDVIPERRRVKGQIKIAAAQRKTPKQKKSGGMPMICLHSFESYVHE
jgi:hypothetical protein